jgi:hypothetical protein
MRRRANCATGGHDLEIREVVERKRDNGRLWSEPLIQFNPAIETHGEVTELVAQGLPNANLAEFFRTPAH